MSDRLLIEVDGSEMQKGTQGALHALAELKKQIQDFASNDPTKRVTAEMQALKTSAVSIVDATTRALSSLDKVIATSMSSAERAAREGGKRVGKGIADGMAEETGKVGSVVTQQIRNLQAQYEAAMSKGWKVNVDILGDLAKQKVRLSPDDIMRLQGWKDSQAASTNNLAMMRRFQKEEQGVFEERQAMVERAAIKLAAFRNTQSDQALRQEQVDSNRTFQMRQRAMRAEEEQAFSHQQMVARASKGLAKLRQEQAVQDQLAAVQALSGPARALVNNLSAGGAYSSIVRGSKFGLEVDPNAAKVTEDLKRVGAAATEAAAAKGLARQRADELKEANRSLAERSREVHSAMRGIAGAGGALFLTYGSLIPLATAFFATSMVRDSINSYKDFEYQLKFVKAVAEDTSTSLEKMMSGVSASATQGGFEPVEAAKGMRILAQAGLDAKEAMEALPTVLAVAKVGELDMAKSAETLTGSMHAFGLGIENMERIGDVFVKAAAISNTSVSQISESMKQASTIAQQYKLSVEDIGVALVALGKRNITGSAAGTAFRNLMDELAAPRGEAKKVAAQLGISLFDPIKHEAKDFFDKFVPELRKKLQQFDPQSQTFILNRLTNNRGAKAMASILSLSDQDLTDLKGQLENATGMARRALIALNDSVQGDMDKLNAKFKESLIGAGSQSAEPLRASLQRLKEVVASPEFINAVAGLGTALTLLLRAATEVASAILSPAGLVVTLGAIGIALSPLPRMAAAAGTAMLGLGGATAAAGAASAGAAGGALALLASLGKFALVAGGVLLLATAVGALYNKLTEKDPIDKAQAHVQSLIRQQKEYQLTLDDTITKLRRKLNLEAGATKDETELGLNIDAARREKERADAKVLSLTDPKRRLPATESQVLIAEQAATVAGRRYNDVLTERNLLLRLQGEAWGKEERRRDLERQAAKRDADAANKAMGSGTSHFTTPDFGVTNTAYQQKKQELQDLLASYADQARALDQLNRHQESMLQLRYDSGAMSFKEYQEELSGIQTAHIQKRIADAGNEASMLAAEMKKLEDLAKTLDPKKNPAEVSANDRRDLQRRIDESQHKIVELTRQDLERQLKIRNEMLKPSVEMVRNADKELASLHHNVDQEVERLRLKGEANTLSERQLFIQQEVLRVTDSINDRIAKEREKLKAAVDSGQLDWENNADGPALLSRMLTYIKSLEEAAATAGVKIREAAAESFDAKKIQDLAKSLNTGLTDAIMNAGEDGGKGFRRSIEEELVRKPFRLVVEALLQPLTNQLASFVYGMVGNITGTGGGYGGGAGGGGIMNMFSQGASLYSMGSKAYNWLGGLGSGTAAYTGTGLSTVGTGYATTGGVGLTGGVNGGGSLYSLSGGGGYGITANSAGASAVGGTVGNSAAVTGGSSAASTGGIGALGTVALLLLPIFAAFAAGMFDGEQRAGGQYSWETGQTRSAFVRGPDGGQIAGDETRALIDATVGGLNAAFKVFGTGISVTSFQAGMETSDNGFWRGGVFTGGQLSTGATFGESGTGTNREPKGPQDSLYEWWSNRYGSQEEVAKNSQLDLKQAMVEALQSAANMAPEIAFRTWTEALPEGAGYVLEGMGADGVMRGKAESGGHIEASQWVRVFDETKQELETVPKSIRDLIRGWDAEMKSEDDVNAMVEKITLKIQSVDALRQALEVLPFDFLTGKTFDFYDALITASKGVDKLIPALQSYFENFYTGEEKRASIAGRIKGILAGVGLDFSVNQILGATRGQFRALTEQFAAMGESGRSAWLALLDVNNMFAQISQELSTPVSKAMDEVANAREALIDSYQDELGTLDSLAKKLQESAKDLRKFREELLTSDLSPLTPGEKYGEARRKFDETYALAMSGDEDALSELQDAASTLLETSRFFNASGGNYQSDFNMVQSALKLAADAADGHADAAEQQVQVMREQLKELGVLNSSVVGLGAQIANMANAIVAAIAAGGMIKPEDVQLTAQMLGTMTGGVTGSIVSTSIGNVYASANGAAAYSGTLYGTNGQAVGVDAARSAITAAINAGQPLEVYYAAKSFGVSLNDLDALMGWSAGTASGWAASNGLPSFYRGGDHGGGWRMVGEYGPELEYTPPSRIYSAPSTSSLLGNNEAVVEHLRALIQKVEEMREQNNQGHALNAAATQTGADEVAHCVTAAPARAAYVSKIAERARTV